MLATTSVPVQERERAQTGGERERERGSNAGGLRRDDRGRHGARRDGPAATQMDPQAGGGEARQVSCPSLSLSFSPSPSCPSLSLSLSPSPFLPLWVCV